MQLTYCDQMYVTGTLTVLIQPSLINTRQIKANIFGHPSLSLAVWCLGPADNLLGCCHPVTYRQDTIYYLAVAVKSGSTALYVYRLESPNLDVVQWLSYWHPLPPVKLMGRMHIVVSTRTCTAYHPLDRPSPRVGLPSPATFWLPVRGWARSCESVIQAFGGLRRW